MSTSTQQHRPRYVSRVVQGLPAVDGAGVELTRVIGTPQLNMLDPFLLLDAFDSNQPDAYIAGFPPHPHRGFETVTYLLAGCIRHRDNAGHEGVIEPGGVQWMTAGRGIVHSEMPEQTDGRLAGFQLWVNLPASHKLSEPTYQEYAPDQIPVEVRESGGVLRVIAGATSRGTRGPVVQPLTEPIYFDVSLASGDVFYETLPEQHHALLYVIDGRVELAGVDGSTVEISTRSLAVLAAGDTIEVHTVSGRAQFLLIAGKPINEPVVRGGPFVMNTKAEIRQAQEDYANGII